MNITEHGAREAKTQTHYTLDMIIIGGYRVKSQNCVIFRRWANKMYMIKGYVVNKERLNYLILNFLD